MPSDPLNSTGADSKDCVVAQAQLVSVAQTVRTLCPVRPTDPRVLRTIAQLEQMLLQRPALAERASRIGLSESRLAHLFRKQTGWTVRRYAKRPRVEVAAHLLRLSPLSIKEIAAVIGTSQSQLTREFKACFGVSPRWYRSSRCGAAAG